MEGLHCIHSFIIWDKLIETSPEKAAVKLKKRKQKQPKLNKKPKRNNPTQKPLYSIHPEHTNNKKKVKVRKIVCMGRAEGWRGNVYVSSLLYLVALLRSSSEIAQRKSSKIILLISVGVSRILLCLKNPPGRQRRNLKLIRVAQNKSCLACNTGSFKSLIWKYLFSKSFTVDFERAVG